MITIKMETVVVAIEIMLHFLMETYYLQLMKIQILQTVDVEVEALDIEDKNWDRVFSVPFVILGRFLS